MKAHVRQPGRGNRCDKAIVDHRAALLDDWLVGLAFADQLAKIDTEGVEPMAHIGGLQNVWREDTVRPSVNRDLLLENAPAKQDGYIFVPQVVE